MIGTKGNLVRGDSSPGLKVNSITVTRVFYTVTFGNNLGPIMVEGRRQYYIAEIRTRCYFIFKKACENSIIDFSNFTLRPKAVWYELTMDGLWYLYCNIGLYYNDKVRSLLGSVHCVSDIVSAELTANKSEPVYGMSSSGFVAHTPSTGMIHGPIDSRYLESCHSYDVDWGDTKNFPN